MGFSEIIECTIDFEGQRLAEQLVHYLLIGTGIVSFIAGYLLQSIQSLLYIFGAGLLVTFLVVVPPWPMYNKNPQPFLQAQPTPEEKVVDNKNDPNSRI